jgi:hypothetical protein
MFGDFGDEWFMVVGYLEPAIGWMTSGMQSIEQTEEFAVTYATNVTNIYGSWLPEGMPKQRIRGPKAFAIDITMGH